MGSGRYVQMKALSGVKQGFFFLGILKDENGNPFKCACCKENAVQCGYPLHEYCAKKWNVDKGCVKSKMSCVPSKEYCLSTENRNSFYVLFRSSAPQSSIAEPPPFS